MTLVGERNLRYAGVSGVAIQERDDQHLAARRQQTARHLCLRCQAIIESRERLWTLVGVRYHHDARAHCLHRRNQEQALPGHAGERRPADGVDFTGGTSGDQGRDIG